MKLTEKNINQIIEAIGRDYILVKRSTDLKHEMIKYKDVHYEAFVNKIIEVVSDHFSITPAELIQSGRGRIYDVEFVLPMLRYIVILICRHNNVPVGKIAMCLKMNHATVINGTKKGEESVDTNSNYRRQYTILVGKCNHIKLYEQ